MLSIADLDVTFPTEEGPLAAVADFDLDLSDGEFYGLVGESGAGKSTVARATMGLLDESARVSGEIAYNGTDLLGDDGALEEIRGEELTMIFQNPSEALNPVMTIGDQLRRVVKYTGDGSTDDASIDDQVVAAMETVDIPNPTDRLSDYPVEFSGGMNQRVMIAMALLCEPDLLIADEPITNLDVTTGANILDLLQEIQDDRGISILYITHNMGTVAHYCDRVGIMYAGKKIEEGPVREVFRSPKHPYTRDLLECIPTADSARANRIETIEGTMPTPINMRDVCYYADRCDMAREACWREEPGLRSIGPERTSACRFPEELG